MPTFASITKKLLGCLKLTYHQEPDFRVIYSKKELTLKNSSQKAYRSYFYGYQGSEKTDELKGSGNHYTTFFRELDPRLGRWWSIDPKTSLMPWQSPYVSMDNNPIWFNDPLGDKIKIKHKVAKTDKDGNVKTNRKGEIKYKSVKTTYEEGMNTDNFDQYGKDVVKSLDERIASGGGDDIKKLELDKKHTVIIRNNEVGKSPYFQGKHLAFKGNKRSIFYNPNTGMEILNDDRTPTGKYATPSEVLGHEFKHASNYFYSFKAFKQRRLTPVDGYDNMEEKYTIENYDNIYWKNKERSNHRGRGVIFSSPTDHDSVSP